MDENVSLESTGIVCEGLKVWRVEGVKVWRVKGVESMLCLCVCVY